jgi:short-subunit dehydrogenase
VVVHPVRADLATFEGVEELAAAARSTGRAVDVLAVTAGGDLAGDGELDAELRVVALNCAGSVHLAKRILPGMVERGAGRVLFTPAASPGSCHAVYAASMAFVAQLAQSLREELQDTGVTVTTLTPGPTDDDPAGVAKEIVRGLMAGEDRVVVGAR